MYQKYRILTRQAKDKSATKIEATPGCKQEKPIQPILKSPRLVNGKVTDIHCICLAQISCYNLCSLQQPNYAHSFTFFTYNV